MRFNVGERVRIIDKRNEYYNHTGIIIRIDFCVYHTVALDLDTIYYVCLYPSQFVFINGDLVNDTITCNLTGNYISLLDRLPTNKEEKRKILPNTPNSVLFNDKNKATSWDSKGNYINGVRLIKQNNKYGYMIDGKFIDYDKLFGVTNLPTRVLFNDKKKATTLIFNDKVVVVKAREDDNYDRRIGLLEAYFQATSGLSKTKALKYLNDIVKDKPKKKKNKEDVVHIENGKSITVKDMITGVGNKDGNS